MKKYSILLFFFVLIIAGTNLVNAQRITVTVAGNGVAGYSGDGLPGKQAQINGAQYVTSDLDGNVYFIDGGRVRKVSVKNGIITTIGGGGSSTSDSIPATSALITAQYICANAIGDIYLGTGNKIRKIDVSTNIITTFAGTGTSGYSGDGGPATSALFDGITDICTDATGNIYIVDKNNNRIRKITVASGIVTTIGGSAASGYTGDSYPATNATLSSPTYICSNPIGDIYFSDQGLRYIRRINATTGIITTYAGGGVPVTHCLASNVRLGPLSGLRFDASYNLCFNETSCSCRKIDHFTDSVEYIGGNFIFESFKDDTNSLYAWMNTQFGLTTDTNDNIYIADCGNNRIRKLIKLKHTPTFAYGRGQAINPCPGYTLSLNSQLAITDLDSAQTETWYVITSPSHGSLSGFPATATSNGVHKLVTPSGLNYLAPSSYTGTDSFVVRISDGTFSDTAIIYVSVQMASTGTISGGTSICTGLTTHMAETVTGGRWSVTNSSATIDSMTGIITGHTAGIDTIIYNIVAPCPLTTFVPITINATPTAGTISGSDTVCLGATTTFTETVTGGVWSSTNPYSASIDTTTGIVTGINFSSSGVVIKYMVHTAFCSSSTTKPIFVNTPTTAISGPSPLCIGSTATYSDAIYGGSWSVSNSNAIITGTSSSSASVMGSTIGTDTIFYTNTNTCGTQTVTIIIPVDSLPSAGTISGPTSVCYSSTITLSSSVSGGYWSSTYYSVIVGSSTGDVTGVSVGTDSITYTVSSSSACSASTGVLITVSSFPTAGTITGSTSVCIGDSISLADVATDGSWSVTNSNASISSTGIVSGIIAGIDSVLYSVSNACGSDTAVSVVAVINAVPNAGTITGPTGVCVGSVISLTDTITGGIWSVANYNASVSGSGFVSGITTGSDSVLYTVSNACGTASAASFVSIINTAPAAGTITGPASVCVGSTIALIDTTTGGNWSVNNANASVSGTGVVSGITAGSDSVLYSVSNACGTATAISIITINTIPDAGTITGPVSVCVGSSITLTDTSIGTWGTSNANATITIGGVVSGVLAGIDTIIYSVSNLCGTAVTKQQISINDCHATGTQLSSITSAINIYPNPTSSILTIEWTELPSGKTKIVITDCAGREVLSDELISNDTHSKQLDLSTFAGGVYLLTIQSGSDYSTSKLVLSKE